jgi:hypothetical protein
VDEVAGQFSRTVMAWIVGSRPTMTAYSGEMAEYLGGSHRAVQSVWRTGCHPNVSGVIVGFNPTIHAMTVQKHCPQTRPATAAYPHPHLH